MLWEPRDVVLGDGVLFDQSRLRFPSQEDHGHVLSRTIMYCHVSSRTVTRTVFVVDATPARQDSPISTVTGYLVDDGGRSYRTHIRRLPGH